MLNPNSKVRSPLDLRDKDTLSRRSLFVRMTGFLILVGGSLPLLIGSMAEAQGKTSKETAKYQEQPKDGHSCSICQYFHPPHTCQLVEGDVNPNGWCMFWAKKT